MKEKATNKDFALKIIDKSMCKGKEHYIDAEVRVMKKLNHAHIMSLYKDIDTAHNMYLILEYVSGKFLIIFPCHLLNKRTHSNDTNPQAAIYSMLSQSLPVSPRHKPEL